VSDAAPLRGHGSTWVGEPRVGMYRALQRAYGARRLDSLIRCKDGIRSQGIGATVDRSCRLIGVTRSPVTTAWAAGYQ